MSGRRSAPSLPVIRSRLRFLYFARKHAIFWWPSAVKSSKAKRLICNHRPVGGQYHRKWMTAHSAVATRPHLTPIRDRRYSSEMIIRARIVATMERAQKKTGGVALPGNRMFDVRRFDDLKIHVSGETVNLGKQVLLPGLINAHCHLDYPFLREKIPPQKSFTDWIR